QQALRKPHTTKHLKLHHAVQCSEAQVQAGHTTSS
ncbi:reverse transcriptase (RNA-dependent DNA polymerase), partial [Trypanosoma vivax Y486]